MGSESGEGVSGELAEMGVTLPGAKGGDGTDDEGGEGESHQENLEADLGACGEPVDDVARGLGRLVGVGLNLAEEESEHEDRGGRDEEEFDGGDRAFDEHGRYFVMQSSV